ncbi:hypothetical protein ATSB10_04160 [Dyella thiooxydans]|uniref:Uncharacterized protein n=1 Tax=Dyella thiooxydans TaxID=445710 RepID=A0A160MXI3_9GAMM|nr:hypothetical protein ATSB10_04160 [Dyella thiooxydans]
MPAPSHPQATTTATPGTSPAALAVHWSDRLQMPWRQKERAARPPFPRPAGAIN